MKSYPLSSPCKDCTRRFIGCHDTCQEYLLFKEGREYISKKRLEEIASAPSTQSFTGKKYFNKG